VSEKEGAIRELPKKGETISDYLYLTQKSLAKKLARVNRNGGVFEWGETLRREGF